MALISRASLAVPSLFGVHWQYMEALMTYYWQGLVSKIVTRLCSSVHIVIAKLTVNRAAVSSY